MKDERMKQRRALIRWSDEPTQKQRQKTAIPKQNKNKLNQANTGREAGGEGEYEDEGVRGGAKSGMSDLDHIVSTDE